MEVQKINEYVTRQTLSYKDIFTTVYTVKTEEGYLLFDAASTDADIDGVILPALKALGITEENLKYVFISHKHRDHAGGLARLLTLFPNVTLISRSPILKEEHPGVKFLFPEDMEPICTSLRVVAIPGHTTDSAALYDERTKMLISGDSLQLYGIFGSGEWGSNITLPALHLAALEKLRGMDIESIYTAHDYHPYGYAYLGREAVENALDACARPLITIQKTIENRKHLSDAEIKAVYQGSVSIPTVSEKVIAAVRAELVGATD